MNNEIYHHGIKGMKWGVRRFRKYDGTLTNAGKKRYADDTPSKPKKKSAHRIMLENKYKEAGLSPKDARAAADKRIKTEKVIAATAGLTVAACAAYYAKNKYAATYCDTVLKAGTTFHNLDATHNPRPGEHLYVNYKNNDVNFFRGQFALGKLKRTGSVFNHELTTTEDIKIPSLNTRKSVFKQLYDNDAEFRKVFNEHSGHRLNSETLKDANKVYKDMWRKMGDKDNVEFNTAKHKYFEALRQKGYEAIVDEWDTDKDVYRSDAPLILLNTSAKSFGEMKIRELTDKEILLAQANSRNYSISRDVLNMLSVPHTNYFGESTKSKARYAAKSVKNSEYIDKALSAMTDVDTRKQVFRKKGEVLADTGKYLTKYKNMSVKTASAIANTKKTAKDAARVTAMAVGANKAYVTAGLAYRDVAVRKYIREHPNTKLTRNQILDRVYGKKRGG